MKNKLKKAIAGIVASAICVIGSMGSLSASAYTAQSNWSLFKTNDPHAPNQLWSDTCYIAAYSGGYQSYCDTIYGSNDRYVDISSNLGLSWYITQPGFSAVYTSTLGGTAIFTFTAVTSKNLTASGTVGYNI